MGFFKNLDLFRKLSDLNGRIEREVIGVLKVLYSFAFSRCSHTFQTIAGLELNADDGVAAH